MGAGVQPLIEIDKRKGNMEIRLETIEMDASIQCRAVIDTATVGEYAERMTEGDVFPPVVLFGTAGKSWIGDGWHRVLAARQIGIVGIEADLRAGGRKEALTHALGANAANGLRRSPADKQRAIEVCVKEFPELTQAKIAEMVGCSQRYVGMVKDGLNRNTSIEIPATITTARGQTRPTQYARKPSSIAPYAPEADPLPDSGEEDKDAPDVTAGGKEGEKEKQQRQTDIIAIKVDANMIADKAIWELTAIKHNDPLRVSALQKVVDYCKKQQRAKK